MSTLFSTTVIRRGERDGVMWLVDKFTEVTAESRVKVEPNPKVQKISSNIEMFNSKNDMNIVGIGAMKMQEELGEIKGHLDRVTHELILIKRIFIGLEVKDKQKTERAWDDLMSVSKEISLAWKGETAVEEIRDQREKKW